MQINQRKANLARLLTAFLDKGKTYTKQEIEGHVEHCIKPDILSEPAFSPDHLRMAMLDAGYIARDQAGEEYRVADGFVTPEELSQQVIDAISNSYVRVQDDPSGLPDNMDETLRRSVCDVKCQSCGAYVRPSSFKHHYLKRHASKTSAEWSTLLDQCFRD